MRRSWLLLPVVLLALGIARADDPWLTKVPSAWNKSEVKRVLIESPWSERVLAIAPWTKQTLLGRYPTGSPTTQRPGETDYPRTPTAGDASQPDGGQPGGGPADAPFFIRWASSRTIRAAFAQKESLEGKLDAEESAILAAEPGDEYEIEVTDDPMVGFPDMDENVLAQQASLELSTSRIRLAPVRVAIRSARDGRVTGVSFYFARKSADGHDVVTVEESAVEFECHIMGMRLGATFHPQRMKDRSGPDF